jgi:hypothetical protein
MAACGACGLLRYLPYSSYYVLSVILGTVALSYGSVPMYKMVCNELETACAAF